MTQLRRTITHWTAGGNRANDLDRQHYHFIVEHDGNIVQGKKEPEDNIVTSDGDYAAHVLNLNTGSIGVAMAGMHGAVESPFDAGPSPITEKQFEAHCLLLAELHRQYSIPITPKTCLTHAEVEPTLGVKQKGKWDITRLPFKPEIRGAIPVGDYMRERVLSYFGAAGGRMPMTVIGAGILRLGSRGEEVRQLQRDLAALGYFPGAADGIYGRRTVDAVTSFQRAHGLEPDGVAGPQTRDAILTRGEPPPPRDVDADILRERGSETIKAADGVDVATLAATGATVVPVVADTIQQANGILPTLSAMLRDHWPALLVIAALVTVFVLSRRIKAARVSAAVEGRDLSK